VPAGGRIRPAPGRHGHQPAGTMTGVRGASLDVGNPPAGKPAERGAVAHEAWPVAAPSGRRLPSARAAVERRKASAPRRARAAPFNRCGGSDLRLSAFRFLFLLASGERGRSQKPEEVPKDRGFRAVQTITPMHAHRENEDAHPPAVARMERNAKSGSDDGGLSWITLRFIQATA